MNMIDMKIKEPEYKEEGMIRSANTSKPQYPCGLSIHLDEESIKKLGIEKLPELNEKLMLACKTEVCGRSESNDLYGPRRSITLQITEMALAPAKQEA